MFPPIFVYVRGYTTLILCQISKQVMDGDTKFAIGTVPQSLVRKLKEPEIGGRVGNIQTTVLLRQARILRKIRKP